MLGLLLWYDTCNIWVPATVFTVIPFNTSFTDKSYSLLSMALLTKSLVFISSEYVFNKFWYIETSLELYPSDSAPSLPINIFVLASYVGEITKKLKIPDTNVANTVVKAIIFHLFFTASIISDILITCSSIFYTPFFLKIIFII